MILPPAAAEVAGAGEVALGELAAGWFDEPHPPTSASDSTAKTASSRECFTIALQ
jgi:hypothetical protein